MAYNHQNVYGLNQEFTISEGAEYTFTANGCKIVDGKDISRSSPNNHELRFMGVDSDGNQIAIECDVTLESRPSNTVNFKPLQDITAHAVNDVWSEVVGEIFMFKLTIANVTAGDGEYLVMTDGVS